MDKIIVAPSILSADFANLQRDIELIEKNGADWVHVDVMDGHFVPNITIGAPVVKSIRKVTKLPLDVHLMIENPEKYIDDFAKAGSDIITVHYEACSDNIEKVIEQIKALGIKVGVSIKPKTPIELLEPILDKIDLILIMTVEPGFGGQSFISDCIFKIQFIKNMLESKGLKDVYLEVDGGINESTAKVAMSFGANALVAGSYVFGAEDMAKAISSLRDGALKIIK